MSEFQAMAKPPHADAYAFREFIRIAESERLSVAAQLHTWRWWVAAYQDATLQARLKMEAVTGALRDLNLYHPHISTTPSEKPVAAVEVSMSPCETCGKPAIVGLVFCYDCDALREAYYAGGNIAHWTDFTTWYKTSRRGGLQ